MEEAGTCSIGFRDGLSIDLIGQVSVGGPIIKPKPSTIFSYFLYYSMAIIQTDQTVVISEYSFLKREHTNKHSNKTRCPVRWKNGEVETYLRTHYFQRAGHTLAHFTPSVAWLKDSLVLSLLLPF